MNKERTMSKATNETPATGEANVYGYCPHCGEPGVSRERRPNGNDTCATGHTYPTAQAVMKNPDGPQCDAPATGQGGHTPEPWYIGTGGAQNAATIRRDTKRGQAIAQVFYTNQQPASLGGCGTANAERIVACVNACAGMADPAATIRELRESLKEARKHAALLAGSFADAAFDRDEAKGNYHELLYAVGNAYPGETRHQTALRYIVEREARAGQTGDAKQDTAALRAAGGGA